MTELTAASSRAIKVHANRGEAEFGRAQRRTRLVKRLKIILPTVAAVAIAGAFTAYRLGPRDLPFSMSGLNLSEKSLTIEKPRVSGFEGSTQSYDLSAERAIQDLSKPGMVRLETIAGNFGVQAGANATMAAKTGLYDSNAQTLVLSDGISVKTTTGYDVSLSEAALDFRQKTLVSSMPVVINTGEGEIHANAVHVTEGGRKIVFDRGVTVTYKPKAGDGIAAESAPAGQ
jgi:lipopolysaccharide export system protein LptC